jgi:hypothetical protein
MIQDIFYWASMLIGLFIFFYLLDILMQNDFNLSKAIDELKKKFNCCVNEEVLKDKGINADLIKDIKKDYDVLDNCKEPAGFPFDICMDDKELSKEDLLIRKILAQMLTETKEVIVDGGIVKKVMPFEATILLTKELSPLVNEKGEIIVKMAKEMSDEELLEKVNIIIDNHKIEDLYNNPEIAKLMQTLELFQKIEKKDVAKQDNKDEKIVAHNEKKTPQQEEIKTDREDFNQPIKNNKVLEPKKEIKLNTTIKEESGFLNIDISEKELQEAESEFNKTSETTDESKKASIEEQAKQQRAKRREQGRRKKIISQHQTTENKRERFYKHLKFIPIQELPYLNSKADFDSKREQMVNIIQNNISALLNNIAKTAPLVFDGNMKNSIFIPYTNLIVAFAKLYGLEYNNVLNIAENIPKPKFLNFMCNILGLDYEKNKAGRYISYKGEVYISYGVEINSDFFKNAFDKQEDYDFFISHPYKSGYSLTTPKETQETTPLSTTSSDVLID